MEQSIFGWLLPISAILGVLVSATVAAILGFYQAKKTRELALIRSIAQDFDDVTKKTYHIVSEIHEIEKLELTDDLKEQLSYLIQNIRELEDGRRHVRGRVDKAVTTLSENPKTASIAEEISVATKQNDAAARELLKKASQIELLVSRAIDDERSQTQ